MYKLAQLLPVMYFRDTKWQLKEPYTVKENKYTLQSPNKLSVNIDKEIYFLENQLDIDLSLETNWDMNKRDYTIADNRVGESFYIYACEPFTESDFLRIILSANSTVPNGYNADNSRKIGGFHCECADIGIIKGHDLSGFKAGDILPASIWDLNHSPNCDIPGLVYDKKSDKWYFIYMPSGTGVSTDSIYNGHVTGIRNWMDFVDDGGAIGMRLLTDSEFQLMASGTPEQAQIWHGRRTTETGGHSAYFLLILNSPPKPWDFLPGTKLIGKKSLRTCTVVEKISSTEYLCKNLSHINEQAHLHYKREFFIPGEIIFDELCNEYCEEDYPKYEVDNRGRIVSNIGCEDCCGVFWQWLDIQGYCLKGEDLATCRKWGWYDLPGNKGFLFGQGEMKDAKMFAGSNWFYGNHSGSRTRSTDGFRWDAEESVSCRFCIDSRKTK